jgi:hypothetical protein
MIESPVLQDLMARRMHMDILRFLKARFGPVLSEVEARLKLVRDQDCLNQLMDQAATCTDLQAFQAQLLP